LTHTLTNKNGRNDDSSRPLISTFCFLNFSFLIKSPRANTGLFDAGAGKQCGISSQLNGVTRLKGQGTGWFSPM
jgi:hypothetical protein